jgi:mono/diheme cytochrome c family protein
MAFLFLAGFSLSRTGQALTFQSLDTQASIDAAKLWDNHCEICHGKDGRAETDHGKGMHARNLADEKWQKKTSDAKIAKTIKKGHEKMPAFESKLSQTEIDALVAYVRQFNPTASTKK